MSSSFDEEFINRLKATASSISKLVEVQTQQFNVEKAAGTTPTAMGCAGTFGTIGSSGGCFGSFGTYGCHVLE